MEEKRVREIIDEVLNGMDFKKLFTQWATSFLRGEDDSQFIQLDHGPAQVKVTITGGAKSGKSVIARLVKESLEMWGADVSVDDGLDSTTYPWKAQGKDLNKLLVKALEGRIVLVETEQTRRLG